MALHIWRPVLLPVLARLHSKELPNAFLIHRLYAATQRGLHCDSVSIAGSFRARCFPSLYVLPSSEMSCHQACRLVVKNRWWFQRMRFLAFFRIFHVIMPSGFVVKMTSFFDIFEAYGIRSWTSLSDNPYGVSEHRKSTPLRCICTVKCDHAIFNVIMPSIFVVR